MNRKFKVRVEVKKYFPLFWLVFIAMCLSCCVDSNKGPDVIKIYEKTPVEKVQEHFENSEFVIKTDYYEMSDGTWKTDDYSYKYKLELTGRLNNAVKDSTYVVLSNTEDITFEQAWKASGLSSDLNDYFKPENAIIVAVK